MALDHIDLDQVTEANLVDLIDNGVAEGRDIDFKRDAYGNADPDRREFMADASSFANTIGGHLIIGMDEANGIASTLPGIDGDPDALINRLEQAARDGIQPRIQGMRMRAVPLTNGRFALVIRIPRSWSLPHRVIAQRSNRFFARDTAGKYEPDVDQLRDLFQLAPGLAARIRDFRLDRLAKIRAGDTQRLAERSFLALHIVPFEAMMGSRRLSINALWEQQTSFRPIAAMGFSPRINLDGLITLTGDDTADLRPAYIQVWREGMIEAVRSPIVRERQQGLVFMSLDTESNLVNATLGYTTAIVRLGIQPPFAILASLVGVRGARYSVPKQFFQEGQPFDRNEIHLSEVVMTELPQDIAQTAALLRPAFDELANAAGEFQSWNFDAQGNWTGR
jgi:hypothetical protein